MVEEALLPVQQGNRPVDAADAAEDAAVAGVARRREQVGAGRDMEPDGWVASPWAEVAVAVAEVGEVDAAEADAVAVAVVEDMSCSDMRLEERTPTFVI